MLFHTLTFWTFFAIVAASYSMLKLRGQNVLLLAAGYVFYGWWDWRFLILIALSTLVDYEVGRRISCSEEPIRRKRWLIVSLVFNLSLLGIFKYLGFAVTQIGSLAHYFGYAGPWWVPHIILPAGISFYTFQSLAYTIEVYKRTTKPAPTLFDYAVYVSFFPQLLAGPIERPGNLLGQVIHPRPRIDDKLFRVGLYFIIRGLFLKIVVADNLGLIANSIFVQPANELTAWEVLSGCYAFAFQIYGDFCGYSTIAQGIARWLGFELMDNFRQPYFATSPRDFWRRWHISLSSWLRDYLFVPLGGNRDGIARTSRNLMITMILGGLWHGASWTFIAWGAFHGIWLVMHRLSSNESSPVRGLSPFWLVALKMLVTFHLICLSWLLFRAQSMDQAWTMLSRLMVDWHWSPMASNSLSKFAIFTIPLLLYEAWVEYKGNILALTHAPWPARACAYLVMITGIIYFATDQPTEFIYFQF
jgi:alginate O-acetyltransferase complex protein AlgI